MRVTDVPALPPSSIPNMNPTLGAATNQRAISEPPKAALPVEVAKPEEEKIAQKYADWAKKEKIFRSKVHARELALQQREEALKAREVQYGANYIEKSKIPEYFQRGNLQDLGLTGDQVTHALLNQPSPQDLKIQHLEAKIAELTGSVDSTKNLFAERDKAATDQALSQILTDVKSLVSNDPQYEVIKDTGSEEAVVDHIKKTFDETGHLMNVEEAAALIENQLLEELTKFAQMKKIQEKLKPAVEVQTAAPKQNAPISKTLTHSQVSSTQKPLSARDRAVLAYEGRLNS